MPDASITSTESTFGTISGTFTADQSTISGTVYAITGSVDGSVGVPGPQGPAGSPGSPGPQGPQGDPGVGVPAGGTAGQYLQKTTTGVDYATDWVTLNLSAYLTKAGNLSGLTDLATARDNLQLGVLYSPTFAGLTVQGSGSNVANLTPTSLTLNQPGYGYFTIQPSQGIVFPDATVQTTAYPGPVGATTWGSIVGTLSSQTDLQTALDGKYSTTNPSGFQTAAQVSTALTPYLLSSTAASTYQTLSGMSDYLSKAGNLSGLASTSTARTNLGLGSLAVVNDAPSDGSQYARRNAAWEVVSSTSPYITSVSSPLSVTAGNLTVDLSAYAPLASPLFTGDARAVTPAFGDNDTSIATTAFVQSALAGGTAVARNLEVEVRNQSGSTIPAGSIVYISGATGNKPLITLAQANNDANSAQTIGFTKTSIANNGTGFVIVRGELENIDTSALTEGVQLYLSPTTAGTWTTTKPSAPLHLVYVGIVIRSHPTLGTILVTVQNGYELEELHDVAIGTLANNDLLAYESSTDLWKNKTYSALGLLTSASAASTYMPLTPGGITMSATGASISIPIGGVYTVSNTIYNNGILIRDAALTPVARFASTEVLIPSVGITFSDATTQTTAGISPATAASIYYPLTGNPSSFLVAADIAGKANLSGATFTGEIVTAASTTTTAGLTLPHGTAPTTPVNGEVWTTTSGLFMRQNGVTRQYVDFDGTQTINGAKTFSNANQTLGNSTAAGTINIGTGATISGSTKAVNIGTNGVAGSTTNIAIGSTTGTSTTTLQGITNGVTQSAGDSSLKLATTAFVTTADNLKANLASPTFTGVPAAPTATPGTNTTQIATTAFVQAAVSGGSGAVWGSITGTLSSQTDLQSALDAKLSTATAASTYQTISGMSSYLTTAAAATTYYPLTGNPSGFLTSAPVTSVAGKTGVVTLDNTDISGLGTMATATAADYSTTTVANGLYYPLSGNPSGFLTSASLTGYATETFVTSQGYITSSALTPYAPLAGSTFTGKVTTVASAAGGAGLNLPHGAAPTTPVNGDIWTTTGNVQWRRNGATQSLPNVGTSNTFSAGAKQTVSHSATTAGLNVGPVAGDPSTPANGDVWYNSTTNGFNARVNGANHQLNTVKAWVNFNGTGTVAIRASMNVTSITDNGVCDYTVNFTTAMTDANYAAMISSNWVVGNNGQWAGGVQQYPSAAPTTTALRMSQSGMGDFTYVNVTIIR